MEVSLQTILIVDDDSQVRGVMVQMLETGGYDALEADSAGQALAVVRELRGAVQCIVSDIDMPGMNGIELAKLVEKEWPETRVMLVSGGDWEHTDFKYPFLQKPFSVHDLLGKLNELRNGEHIM